MKDERKTKEQLISELTEIRQLGAEHEVSETRHDQAEVRLEKEVIAVAAVVNDMLRGEVDDSQTEERVLNVCLEATDSVYGQIGRINEQGKYDTTTYSSLTIQDCAFPDALAWEVSTGMDIRGIWGWPMLHSEPLLCNDLPAHPDRVNFPKDHVPLHCFLGIPLKRDGEVVGMVAVANKPGGYSQVDMDILIRLAAIISVSQKHREALISVKRTSAELEQLVSERTEALRKSEQDYRALFEESGDVVFFSTPDGKLIDINPAGVELFGYSSKEEILRINIAENLYFDPQDRTNHVAALNQHGYIKESQLMLRTKDGDKLIVLETAKVVRDDDGNAVMYRGIMRDITRQSQLEQQLLQSQKMEAVGRLAGGIAHDFNNALTVILGNSDLILASQIEDDPPDIKIMNIRKAATHAAELTQQLLAFSRKQITDPRILEVNSVISGIQGMLQRVIGEDIKLKTSFSADVGNIRMDPGQVEQVLMNLVVNARQAMPRGGIITVETERVELDETYFQTHLYAKPGQYARITVSDTGIGMNEEIQEHLYEPFYTTKKTGTGLGMSTVYGIVKQNNGLINVYSEEGTGTTFKIYIPISSDHPDEFPSETDRSELTGGTETILVVEDDDAVRELTFDILTDLGYQVHAFSNAEDALDYTRNGEEPADLLLTDVVMPDMDGAILAEAVVKVWPSIRVLYMSGYTNNAIASHGVLNEGIKFLQKPFTQADIARKIREVLDADQTD